MMDSFVANPLLTILLWRLSTRLSFVFLHGMAGSLGIGRKFGYATHGILEEGEAMSRLLLLVIENEKYFKN